jgi:PAS domain-containing protein
MIRTLSAVELRIAALSRLDVPGMEIARRLGISMGAVQTHRKNIRRKLGLRWRRFSLRHSLGPHGPREQCAPRPRPGRRAVVNCGGAIVIWTPPRRESIPARLMGAGPRQPGGCGALRSEDCKLDREPETLEDAGAMNGSEWRDILLHLAIHEPDDEDYAAFTDRVLRHVGLFFDPEEILLRRPQVSLYGREVHRRLLEEDPSCPKRYEDYLIREAGGMLPRFMEEKHVTRLLLPLVDHEGVMMYLEMAWYLAAGTKRFDRDQMVRFNRRLAEYFVRRSLEIEARRREQMVYQTVAHFPLGVAVLDPDDRFLFANAAFADCCGRQPEELLQRPYGEVLPGPNGPSGGNTIMTRGDDPEKASSEADPAHPSDPLFFSLQMDNGGSPAPEKVVVWRRPKPATRALSSTRQLPRADTADHRMERRKGAEEFHG